MKVNLKGLSRRKLTEFIVSIGEKPFRADQIWSWMYVRNETDFERMTNLAKTFRRNLSETAAIRSLKKISETRSPSCGTVKVLWELDDGLRIESVYIPESDRKTFCISSQVGCAMGCRFCATAGMGFTRNLTPYEMVDQVLSMMKETGARLTNLVVMGMGEPFLNYENVIEALGVINDPEGLAVGHRKITLSTSGIAPQILRYAREGQPYQLAISLNGVTDAQRSGIMPVNDRYPIAELLSAARIYAKSNRQRITFEYVLISGINDSDRDARELLSLLSGIRCKVNLIAYNPTSYRFARPGEERIKRFAEIIQPLAAPITVRLSRGDDIRGACGQLAVANPGPALRSRVGPRLTAVRRLRHAGHPTCECRIRR